MKRLRYLALSAQGELAGAARARVLASAWRADYRRLDAAHRRAAVQYRRWRWKIQASQADVAAQALEDALPAAGAS